MGVFIGGVILGIWGGLMVTRGGWGDFGAMVGVHWGALGGFGGVSCCWGSHRGVWG